MDRSCTLYLAAFVMGFLLRPLHLYRPIPLGRFACIADDRFCSLMGSCNTIGLTLLLSLRATVMLHSMLFSFISLTESFFKVCIQQQASHLHPMLGCGTVAPCVKVALRHTQAHKLERGCFIFWRSELCLGSPIVWRVLLCRWCKTGSRWHACRSRLLRAVFLYPSTACNGFLF